MKRIVACLSAAVVAGICWQANASVILYDNFDYPDGSLVPNGGWANHSGNAGDLMVSGGKVMVQHGIPSEDANIAYAAETGSVFYGIDFSVDSIASPSWGDEEYFASFREGFNLRGRLDVSPPTGAGDYTVGIATLSGSADAVWATDLSFDTTYRAVVEFNQDTNQARLWIDASASTDTSILGADESDPGNSMNSFALRQSDSTNNETVWVDGLVLGTSFDDVVSAIPEPGTFALLGLGGLLAAIRRRR